MKYNVVLFVQCFLVGILLGFGLYYPQNDIDVSKKSLHRQEIIKLYKDFSSEWKIKDKISVKVIDDDEMKDAVKKQYHQNIDNILGFYVPSEKSITVLGTTSSYKSVFAHEYGHAVWDLVLTKQERKKFMHMWVDRIDTTLLVSEYAEYSYGEGFAEEYMVYMTTPTILIELDEEMYKWFEDVKSRIKTKDKK